MNKKPVFRTIPGAALFAGVLAWLGSTGANNRQQRIDERNAIKRDFRKGKSSPTGRSYRWYMKRKRLRKLARLARRKNRQVSA